MRIFFLLALYHLIITTSLYESLSTATGPGMQLIRMPI